MKYIIHKRFKDKAICGNVNIPAMTVCECDGAIIKYNGSPICAATSENAHMYFALDDDGQGMLRGGLTCAIQKKLSKRDNEHQERWDKVWEDPICKKYKRTEHADHWLWNHNFYNANIWDLQHIARLIGIKEG